VLGALTIETTHLPDAEAGVAYQAQLWGSGGKEPYVWSAQGLPTGLGLDPATGTISGQVDMGGMYGLGIRLTDARGSSVHRDVTLSVLVSPRAAAQAPSGCGCSMRRAPTCWVGFGLLALMLASVMRRRRR
jgi:MYXO-CTERM domain-containing protein